MRASRGSATSATATSAAATSATATSATATATATSAHCASSACARRRAGDLVGLQQIHQTRRPRRSSPFFALAAGHGLDPRGPKLSVRWPQQHACLPRQEAFSCRDRTVVDALLRYGRQRRAALAAARVPSRVGLYPCCASGANPACHPPRRAERSPGGTVRLGSFRPCCGPQTYEHFRRLAKQRRDRGGRARALAEHDARSRS